MKHAQQKTNSLRSKSLAVALATAGLAPLSAFASTSVPVANGTFQTVSPLASGQCTLAKGCTAGIAPQPGWTFNGPNVGILNPSATMYASWSGGYVGVIGGELDGPDWMNQTLATMPANVTYTLSFDLGCRLDKPCSGYVAEAYAGQDFGTLLKSMSASATTQTQGAFQHITMSFDSIGGQPLTIRFSITKKGVKAESDFDNVQVTYVPK